MFKKIAVPIKKFFEKNKIENTTIHEKYELSEKQRAYKHVKEIIDKSAAFCGCVILSPIFLGIIVAIKAEEGVPAPVLFKQRRVGENQELFELYKFRTMRLDTPHDRPTHLLENPDQYITKIGSRLSTKEQKNLKRNGNVAFCGVFFMPFFRFCPYYGYQHV